MSATLKFGTDGKWAVKEGSTLAYNDENGNFKPLPFTFDRAGSATRVNKQGLIEVVPNNEPRIDFLNDSKGALLLEPTRNNYIPYSTLDFNGGSSPQGWSIGFGTGTYSYEQLTYKGQKAVKQTQITTGRSYLDTGSISILANTEHTLKIQFILDECVADANDDIVSFLGFGNLINYKFSDIDTSGVLEVQYNPSSGNVGNLRIGLGCVQDEDGGKSLAWAIPQLEQGSYATSYIPTQGSIGTRVDESCSVNNLDDNVASQNAWTAAGEFIKGQDKDNAIYIMYAYYLETTNLFRIRDYSNSVRFYLFEPTEQSYGIPFNLGQSVKWSIRAKSDGTYTLYVNGNLIAERSGTFRKLDAYNLFGNAKVSLNNLKIYNEALTDQELINLTKI